MALNLAQVNTRPSSAVSGDHVEIAADFTGDASYPTGGYTLSGAVPPVTLTQVDLVIPSYTELALAPYVRFNYATQKLQFFSAVGTEVTNATNVTTITGRLFIRGIGFPTFSPSR